MPLAADSAPVAAAVVSDHGRQGSSGPVAILPRMGGRNDRLRRALPAFASTGGFAVLAAALAVTGELPVGDAAAAVLAVVAGFGATGWYAPVGWRRRAAEAALVPAAAVLMLVGDLAMARMLLPPLLIFAAAAAFLAARARSEPSAQPLLVACFAVAVRAAVGVGMAGAPVTAMVVTVAAGALVSWAVAHWSVEVGVATALVVGVLPLASRPWIALAVALGVAWMVPWMRPAHRPATWIRAWMPGLAALTAIGAAVAPWGGIAVHRAFPGAGFLCLAALLVTLAVARRLPPAAAGALWFVAAVGLGPLQGPPPERGATALTSESPQQALPAGTGGRYVLDLALQGARGIPTGAAVGALELDGRTLPLRLGREVADSAATATGPATRPVFRPARVGREGSWRAAGRTTLSVAAGARPLLRRAAGLPAQARLVIATAGPAAPTAPRDWTLPAWLWATAGVVGLLQLLGGTWRRPIALAPWAVLTVGQAVARVSVEPLRLLGERFAVDLCLAALLAAWLPAAWTWLRRGRLFAPVLALLLPLALATPHLTPPLRGDEPFHLVVMQSLAKDHDLDIRNNLDVEHHPGDRAYLQGRPLLHSPVLAGLLLPGYVAAGRSGALALLAAAGALLVLLLGLRARRLGVPERRLALLVLVVCLTYPLATYATQIWPELPGALAAAAVLVLVAAPPRGPWLAIPVALVAAAVKTRLALVTFPSVLAGWLRAPRRLLGPGLATLALAGAASLAVGWVSMGHPFGYYRRLPDLVPRDGMLALRVVGGLLFDHAGGLAFAAPLLLVGLASMGILWRRGGVGERALLVGGALTVLALLPSVEWYGGGSPPARYLVPLLPAFVLALGLALRSPRRWRRLAEVLVIPSLVVWWALVTRPHFAVNPGDGGWWLADALARRFAADTQQLFPSFLVPTTATLWLPPVVVVLGLGAAWLTRRRPAAVRSLVRTGLALWLVAAAGLTLAIVTRHDRVVEIEAPQVRHHGGRPMPPAGTFSRFAQPNGWLVEDGDFVVVPVNLARDAQVWVEGWLLGTAQRGAGLDVRWDDGPTRRLRLGGGKRSGRVRLPGPPDGVRHRLLLRLAAPPGGGAVLDRLVVRR